MNLTADQLRSIMPRVPPQYVEEYAEAATKTAERFQINTRLRMAAWLANIAYESDQLNGWGEYGGGGGAFGWYYGRGPIQLTHRDNYIAAGYYLGLNLVDNPNWVSDDTQIGFNTAGWFWRYGNGDLNDFADEGNLWECYKRILGGDNGSFTQRKAFYDKALAVLATEGNENVLTAQDIIDSAYKLQGVFYRTWYLGDPLPMWRKDGYDYNQAPPVSHMEGVGVMCSDLVNYALVDNGLEPGYGTEAFAEYLVNQQAFDPSTPGVPGAIALSPYRGPALSQQGHIAIYVDEHTLIQALTSTGVSDQFTDTETYNWGGATQFTHYGFLPGVDYGGAESDGGGAGDGGGSSTEEPIWKRHGWYTYESETSWSLKYYPGSE